MELAQFTNICQDQCHNGHAAYNLKIRIVRGGVWMEVAPNDIEFDTTLDEITLIVKD